MSYYNKRRKHNQRQQITNFAKETKYFDTSIEDELINNGSTGWVSTELPTTQRVDENGTTITAYAENTLIPSATGTGYGQVIGNHYNLKHIRIRGFIKTLIDSDQVDVHPSLIVRLVLILDTQPNGAQAQGEDIFTDFVNSNSNVHTFLAMGDNPGRFRILQDRRIVLQGTNTAADNTGPIRHSHCGEGQDFSIHWKPKETMHVRLKGATGSTPGITELSNANIFLLALQSGVTNQVRISACCRAYYCE